MAYQNISKCRMYINIPDFLALKGQAIPNVFRTLPVGGYPGVYNVDTIPSNIDTEIELHNPYIAVLSHSADSFTVDTYSGDIINGTQSNCQRGFSIADLNGVPSVIDFGEQYNVGSILIGTYYDIGDRSPDLNLTLSYEYDGVKNLTTKGGSSLSNSYHQGVPNWGSRGAWELGGNPKYAKSGRRVWSLSYSFLSDSAIFPDNAGLVNEDPTDTDTTLNLLKDDTLQRAIHLVGGSQLPFIFQSDATTDTPKPDQFAIAKLDQNSFKYTQTSFNTYTARLKIKEVW